MDKSWMEEEEHEKFIESYEISADNMHTTTRNTFLCSVFSLCCCQCQCHAFELAAVDCGYCGAMLCMFFCCCWLIISVFHFTFMPQKRVNIDKRENMDEIIFCWWKKGIKISLFSREHQEEDEKKTAKYEPSPASV